MGAEVAGRPADTGVTPPGSLPTVWGAGGVRLASPFPLEVAGLSPSPVP